MLKLCLKLYVVELIDWLIDWLIDPLSVDSLYSLIHILFSTLWHHWSVISSDKLL
mgnify:CR=1 FL=1